MRRALLGTCAVMLGAACGGNVIGSNEICGDGTHDDAGTCVPDDYAAPPVGVTCGPGTHEDSRLECVPGDADAGVSPTRDASTGGDASYSDTSAGGDSASSSVDPNTACNVSDNIFVITGDDWVHAGPPLVIRGGTGWSAPVHYAINGQPSFVTIEVGNNWSAVFSTNSLGVPLLPGTYSNVQRADFTDPNRPGLDVYGDGRGCNEVGGQFRVIEMSASPVVDGGIPQLLSFTAVFDQHCEGSASSNAGCVHFAQ